MSTTGALSTAATVGLWAVRIALLFLSIILHEISHGYAAYLMGDDTAKRAGRLSLNPIRHVDPVGTLIMPVVLLALSRGTFSFGYAKPVPINPRRFRDERRGMLITGSAGPLTNIVIAVVMGLAVRGIVAAAGTTLSTGAYFVIMALVYVVQINLMLAFFNLIPIPPLDGSRVVQRFLPDRARDAYHRLEPYGFVIVIALSYFAPKLFNAYLTVTVTPIFSLLTGLS